MDNQLFGALYPVMLYMTPSPRKDQADKTPFLTISAAKVPSAKWNAEIFKVRQPADLVLSFGLFLSQVNLCLYIHTEKEWERGKTEGEKYCHEE